MVSVSIIEVTTNDCPCLLIETVTTDGDPLAILFHLYPSLIWIPATIQTDGIVSIRAMIALSDVETIRMNMRESRLLVIACDFILFRNIT